MEQIIVKDGEHVELEDLYLVLMKHKSKQDNQQSKQLQYELYDYLNPKYFEESYSLLDAKLKIESLDIMFSTKFDIFRIL